VTPVPKGGGEQLSRAANQAATAITDNGLLKLDFDRRLMLQFHGSVVTSDAGVTSGVPPANDNKANANRFTVLQP
jgi:hypothetical protein